MSPAAGWVEADGAGGQEPSFSFVIIAVSSSGGEAAESFLACTLRMRACPLAVRGVSVAGGAGFVVSVGGVRRFFVTGVSSSCMVVQLTSCNQARPGEGAKTRAWDEQGQTDWWRTGFWSILLALALATL